MATLLKNILTFANIPPAGDLTLPHGLNIDGVGVIPDVAIPDGGDFAVANVTDTTIQVFNNGSTVASINLLVEYWYSPERVFGVPQDNVFSRLLPGVFAPYFASFFGDFPIVVAASANPPNTVNATPTDIPIDTINSQVGINYEILGGSPTSILVHSTGYYLILYTSGWTGNSAGGRHFEIIQGNAGSPTNVLQEGQQTAASGVAAIPCTMTGVALYLLNNNDTIALRCYQNSGGNLTIQFAYLAMIKLASA